MKKPTKTTRLAAVILPLLLLSGCAATDLQATRKYYSSEASRKKAQEAADLRAQTISDGETFYGKKLACLSDMHKDFFAAQTAAAVQAGQLQGNGRFRMAISPIRDKTGKIFDINSTVLSDMVMDAVAKFKHFDVLETPMAPDGLTDSRNNFLDPRYTMPAGIVQNFSATMTSLQHLPVGVIFPSNYYISGAIIQYDEDSVIPPQRDISADIYQYQFQRRADALTTTINLRLVDSWTGAVVRIAGSDELASVNLTNTFYKIQTQHNFFRLIGTKDYGIDYSVTVGDPKTAVVKEMVDKGVYQLLDKFLKPYQVRKESC